MMEESKLNYKNILFQVIDSVGLITINRPEVRNALDITTTNEIHHLLDDLRENEEVKVIIFTGAGDKAFVAGADINVLKEKTFLDVLVPASKALMTKIEEFDKPVLAAINGYALGGGCELALACDIRIASEQAKLGLPELNLAIIPGGGGTQRLTRLVGKGKAKELIFTGDMINAAEALRIGLVNKVVPVDELIPAALDMAKKMMTKGPLALKLAKIAINTGADSDLHTGLLIEKLAQSILFSTQDKLEGTSAFLEKRTPNYRGR
jgi:enoyl-CoA hydratase